ncbi:MAG: D-serine ammonia-lyase [Desulfovibrio sp.]
MNNGEDTLLNDEFVAKHPLLKDMSVRKPVFWCSDSQKPLSEVLETLSITPQQVEDAHSRLERFQPFIASAFPQTFFSKGVIESPLQKINKFHKYLQNQTQKPIGENIYLKKDSHLPISGSVKARGGIYEVLCYAERLALTEGLLSFNDDYSILLSERMKEFYSNYSLSVGSTGNLGLSIGIIGAKFGLKTTVHMSADARQWKKDHLRSLGVTVVEYESDYEQAVAEGRKLANDDPLCHFVDDENSKNLFLGYAVAGKRLKAQLEKEHVSVDSRNPLIVYLPCGVGGAPGGITFGLKLAFGDNVHCYFAEPIESPCMTLGLMTGLHDKISVRDIGLNNQTAADGLAVARPSRFVGQIVEHLISGAYTITDEDLYRYTAIMDKHERIKMEPSALASAIGPLVITHNAQKANIPHLQNATHILWGTGGAMVPKKDMKKYLQMGKDLLK